MKEKYLNKLNEALRVAFYDEEAKTIINDYNELFEDYLSSGLTEEEVIKKLGEPNDIVKSLIDENKRIFPIIGKKHVILPKKSRYIIIQSMPILAVIIYLVLGYTLEAWHPGWLVFFLIPISTILLKPYKRGKIRKLTPFLAVAIFILIGTYVEDGYFYSWIVFLLIPLMGIVDSNYF